MIRVDRRLAAALGLVALLLSGSLPASGHSPSPLIGWPAWNQNQQVGYRWLANRVPPAAMQAAVKAGVADANASRGSRAPTFVFDAGASSTVEYGADVFCGPAGLACADGSNAPNSFRLGFRVHGYRFDWGVLRWCQLLSTIANGCFDVENIALDEIGHVLGLGHHANFADNSDYGDSVVQTVSRARPAAFWNAHAFGRCDVATLQARYDQRTWNDPYSTCLDLDTELTLASSAASIWTGTTITFSATLVVGDNPGDGRLTGNPIAGRSVTLQRRPIGASTWTTMGTMAAGAAAGTYQLKQSPTATYEWRAVFSTPANEGLNGTTSGGVVVSVSGCSGSCPQSVVGAESAPLTGR